MLLCSDLVQLEWADDRGVFRRSAAILEEINASGALLLLDMDQVPRRSHPVLLSPGGYAGRARQCLVSDAGVRLEIAFDPGFRWSVEEYRPRHSFDPRTLAASCRFIRPLNPIS